MPKERTVTVRTGPDSINLDFRVFALLLTMASRDDLLEDYLKEAKNNTNTTKWKRLRDIGFPLEMLNDNLYLFENEETKDALKQTREVMKTMVSLNDYCKLRCPTDAVLQQITAYAAAIQQPLALPGKEG